MGGGIGEIREVEGGRREIFTLGSRKMNHIPILLEHVDFLNGLNRLHIELLKRRLQLLVIRARSLMDFFHLSPGGAFATILHNQPLLARFTRPSTVNENSSWGGKEHLEAEPIDIEVEKLL